MLRLKRRPPSEFLGASHQQGLKKRVTAAQMLSRNTALTAVEKSKRIGNQWDAFRAGRTSAGTFTALWCELRAMAFNKCAFCETPAPDTVEHLEEKSKVPAKAFDWDNLLPACSTCNRNRECSGIPATPMDPSTLECLDYLGWDEYGGFAPSPTHRRFVLDNVQMYGLHRFQAERQKGLQIVRTLLATIITESPLREDTLDALRMTLSGTSAWLGPIREYLLRPPTDDDKLLVEEALRQRPEIRTWVEPWLRPPTWASPRWQ